MATLFFSYSHKDEELRNELEIHLALLKRQGVIATWHDRRITAGREFDSAISAELEGSDIVLLLVSASFLASDYCYEKEMTRAIERHERREAVVIPVILHPCDWHSAPFGRLRATPTDGKPVSMFANQQEAFAIIAKDVREAASAIAANKPANIAEQVHSSAPSAATRERSSNLRIKRRFDDQERDQFLEDSYEYMARYFDGSLEELANRNPQIKTRFKRLSGTGFTASIYSSGKRVAACSVWYGSEGRGSAEIYYSNSENHERGSYNESLSVADDGFSLQLKALGMPMTGLARDEGLSQQGAAEYYWSLLIRPLQE
jgi:hypothetical protein